MKSCTDLQEKRIKRFCLALSTENVDQWEAGNTQTIQQKVKFAFLFLDLIHGQTVIATESDY